MTVMQGYEPMPLGQDVGLPAPPGTSFPTGFPVDLFVQIASILRLKSIGIYTPWAGREGGIDWEPVRQPPDTNITVSILTDQAVLAVPTATFGSQLPFVAILTEVLPTPNHVESAWNGSPYQAYQTQAVYRQDDPRPTPRIYFLHWGELRPPGGGRGNKSLEAAAAMIGGKLVFAMQVNYATTAMRQPPALPFDQAIALQLGTGGPKPIENGVMPPPVTTPPAPPKKASMVAPVAFGAAIAAVTYYVMRRVKKGG